MPRAAFLVMLLAGSFALMSCSETTATVDEPISPMAVFKTTDYYILVNLEDLTTSRLQSGPYRLYASTELYESEDGRIYDGVFDYATGRHAIVELDLVGGSIEKMRSDLDSPFFGAFQDSPATAQSTWSDGTTTVAFTSLSGSTEAFQVEAERRAAVREFVTVGDLLGLHLVWQKEEDGAVIDTDTSYFKVLDLSSGEELYSYTAKGRVITFLQKTRDRVVFYDNGSRLVHSISTNQQDTTTAPGASAMSDIQRLNKIRVSDSSINVEYTEDGDTIVLSYDESLNPIGEHSIDLPADYLGRRGDTTYVFNQATAMLHRVVEAEVVDSVDLSEHELWAYAFSLIGGR